MFALEKENIRSIITIPIDNAEGDLPLMLADFHEPFLFLEKNREIFAYIRTKDINSVRKVAALVKNSVSIENVSKSNHFHSDPFSNYRGTHCHRHE